ncbi:putative hydrolase-oxidase [Yersinia pseudotuberculosis]|nr:putative hydrolase-oxidase [Yersinia pseudotuberculosis]
MMRNIELETVLNNQLNIGAFQDYAPNGLQVEGRRDIQRVVTGVTASQALLDAAVAHQADAILVHHGYFWKNEPVVVRGMKRNRLKTLLIHDINLYGYHLPLDAHPELGNNAQLAKLLDIQVLGEIESLLPYGEFTTPLNAVTLRERLEKQLGRSVLHCGDRAPAEVRRIAWCTGGGQGYIQQAAEFGVDAFITGEVSEQTIHIAREMKVNFYAAGHHATERYGIKALGEWLTEQHQLDVTFIDIPNPA